MNPYRLKQRGTIKGRPWGMTPGTKGRISKVFKPGEGAGYDAEFKARGWTPMRVKAGEVDVHESAVELVDLLLDGQIDPKELRQRHKIGVEVEGEHTDDPKKKSKIAREHEKENPLYYPDKPKPAGKKEALRWVENEGPCPGCTSPKEGRRLELEQLGWIQRGWGSTARWTNIPGTYEVYDEIIDQLPDDEWAYIRAATNANSPADVNLPQPQSKSLGDYERERTVPKATVLGDQTNVL